MLAELPDVLFQPLDPSAEGDPPEPAMEVASAALTVAQTAIMGLGPDASDDDVAKACARAVEVLNRSYMALMAEVATCEAAAQRLPRLRGSLERIAAAGRAVERVYTEVAPPVGLGGEDRNGGVRE